MKVGPQERKMNVVSHYACRGSRNQEQGYSAIRSSRSDGVPIVQGFVSQEKSFEVHKLISLFLVPPV